MQRERDVLVREIFPELRRRCRERYIEFAEVDLRWGITEEQAQRGETLRVCLEEVEACRPYFIGLIGERYGWVPERQLLTPELLDRFPWLHASSKSSVTELEILHGVLNQPDMRSRAFFYFRARRYLDGLSDMERKLHAPDDAEAAARLARLKERIGASGARVRKDYADPSALGALVMSDLWEAIDAAFPVSGQPDAEARDEVAHQAFARMRRRVFVGAARQFAPLQAALLRGGTAVISGGSGYGKSALLANWIERVRGDTGAHRIWEHYIGATAVSGDLASLLRRLTRWLDAQAGAPSPAHETLADLIFSLPSRLATAAARVEARSEKLLIVIDALNQLDSRDAARELGWLPETVPAGILLVVSSTPGLMLDELRRRSWPEFEVVPWSIHERRDFVHEYLGFYRKRMEPELRDSLLAAPATAHPLYVKVLLDELRLSGDRLAIGPQITQCLMATDAVELIGRVLWRVEQELDADAPGFVPRACAMLWAARNGLGEQELVAVTGGTPLALARLRLRIADLLTVRSGRLVFFHDAAAEAVRRRYLQLPADQTAAHVRLARWFAMQRADERTVEELPWLWWQAGEWSELAACLADPAMLDAASPVQETELAGYWRVLPPRRDFRMTRRLARFFGPNLSRRASHDRANRVIRLLLINGHYDDAARALPRRWSRYRRADRDRALESLELIASALVLAHRYGAAKSILQEWPKDRQRDPGYLFRLVATQIELQEFPATETALAALDQAIETAGPSRLRWLTLKASLALAQARRSGELGHVIGAATGARMALDHAVQIYGGNHPESLAALVQVADIAQELELEDARTLATDALARAEAVLGRLHPTTILARFVLANAIAAAGEGNLSRTVVNEATLDAERVFYKALHFGLPPALEKMRERTRQHVERFDPWHRRWIARPLQWLQPIIRSFHAAQNTSEPVLTLVGLPLTAAVAIAKRFPVPHVVMVLPIVTAFWYLLLGPGALVGHLLNLPAFWTALASRRRLPRPAGPGSLTYLQAMNRSPLRPPPDADEFVNRRTYGWWLGAQYGFRVAAVCVCFYLWFAVVGLINGKVWGCMLGITMVSSYAVFAVVTLLGFGKMARMKLFSGQTSVRDILWVAGMLLGPTAATVAVGFAGKWLADHAPGAPSPSGAFIGMLHVALSVAACVQLPLRLGHLPRKGLFFAAIVLWNLATSLIAFSFVEAFGHLR